MTTIIHLISDQTVQNVLPVAAFRPQTIVQIRSAHPRFEKVSKNTANACRMVLGAGGSDVLIKDLVLDEEHPTFHTSLLRMRNCISNAKDGKQNVWVNLTGGTKPMSLAAYQAAQEAGCETLYCDTGRREFTGTPVDDSKEKTVSDFAEAASQLNVTIVLAAYGKRRGDWKSCNDLTQEAEEFGRAAFALRLQYNPAISQFVEAALRPALHRNNKFLEKGWLREALEKPFSKVSPGAVTEYLQLAEAAGLVRYRENTGWFFDFPADLESKPLKNRIKSAFNALSGLWLEYYCHAILRQSTRFNDIHANVEPVGSSRSIEFGETDFVCFDTVRMGIAVISCKAENPKLEHIEAVKARSQELGGSHALAVICAFIPRLPEEEIELLVHRARSMGVTLVCNQRIESFLSESPA